jgi:hypothetical protein
MAFMFGKAGAREASIAAVVIRADGTKEDLGVIAYYHKNPLRRAIWRLKHWRRS